MPNNNNNEMKAVNFKIKKRFLGEWILAVSIAWPAGVFMAIILSETIVNLFYPEETNLIVGLCIGGATGFAQWLVLKKSFKVSIWWIFASAIGFGIPFSVLVILEETGTVLPEPLNNENLNVFIVGCIGGFLTGLLQMPVFKSISKYSGWWVAISSIGWGISMLSTVMVGGVILGVLTGFSVLWLLKFPLEEPV